MLIQDMGDYPVFKALVGHHMTPMTGTVTDAHNDGFIFFSGTLKCLVTPGISMHRIVSALQ